MMQYIPLVSDSHEAGMAISHHSLLSYLSTAWEFLRTSLRVKHMVPSLAIRVNEVHGLKF